MEEILRRLLKLEKRVATLERQKISTGKGLNEEEWFAYLATVYQGIDLQREYAKCKAYFPNIEVSRKRFLNWLNRADKPIKGNGDRSWG